MENIKKVSKPKTEKVKEIIVVYNVFSNQLEYYKNKIDEANKLENAKVTANYRKGKTIKTFVMFADNSMHDNFTLIQEYHLDTKRKLYHIIADGKDILTSKKIYNHFFNSINVQEFDVRLKSKVFNSQTIVEEMTRIYFIKDVLQKSYFSFDNNKYEIPNDMFNYFEPTIYNNSFVKLNNDVIEVTNDVFLVYKNEDEKEQWQIDKLVDNNVISYYNYSDTDNELYIKDTIVDESIIPINDKIVKDEILEILKDELDALSSEELEIIKSLFLDNITERKLSTQNNIPQSTIHYQKKKILKKLYSKFLSKGINDLY